MHLAPSDHSRLFDGTNDDLGPRGPRPPQTEINPALFRQGASSPAADAPPPAGLGGEVSLGAPSWRAVRASAGPRETGREGFLQGSKKGVPPLGGEELAGLRKSQVQHPHAAPQLPWHSLGLTGRCGAHCASEPVHRVGEVVGAMFAEAGGLAGEPAVRGVEGQNPLIFPEDTLFWPQHCPYSFFHSLLLHAVLLAAWIPPRMYQYKSLKFIQVPLKDVGLSGGVTSPQQRAPSNHCA